MANTYLTRTQSSTGSETKGTFSAWVKRGALTTASNMYTSYQADNEFCDIQFNSSDQLQVVVKIGGTDYLDLRTTRLFRDISAFYHILVAFDSTDGTQADRCKIYVNGTRETSFATNTNNVSSSLNMRINGSSQDPYIGSWHNQGNYFSGVMSHVHWVDGTAYGASTFGSTDSTTGEWSITTSPSITMGTNGFTILKDGNTITDQSTNSNDFTLGGGTLTNTEDCPSNVFATLNPLQPQASLITLSNGNTSMSNNNNAWDSGHSTLGVNTGKWYWEAKIQAAPTYVRIGIDEENQIDNVAHALGESSNQVAYNDAGDYVKNNVETSYGATFTTGDIIGVALDLDNNKIYFSKNGVFQNSGVPTSGATGTGAISITGDLYYFPAASCYGTGKYEFNFGNGYFGTTAISSEGTNASGIGKFEYDVPTGYTALSTKGLNE